MLSFEKRKREKKKKKKTEKKEEEEIHLASPLVALEIGLFDWRIRAPQKKPKININQI